MSDFFERLGFPAPEQRDSIRFHFAKGLTYVARRNLVLGFLFAGLIVQIIMMSLFPGILFLLIAVLLGLVKGYDSRIRLKNFKNDETWTEVPIEKIREIEMVRQKSRDWDRDSLDITNPSGFMIFMLLIILGLAFVILATLVTQDLRVGFILVVDYLILVVPFYFTGVRWALKQGNLSIKVKLLLALHSYFSEIRMESESFVPMMLLARENEKQTVPVDVKFQIRYKGLPPDRFYGLQSIVNINLVQGTSYAYFYCVLVAKPGFGLKQYQSKVKESNRVMCEYQEQSEAEVLVIRHPTSKRSGYFTDDDACKEILTATMNAARIIECEYAPAK
jgi:hypothetical protein